MGFDKTRDFCYNSASLINLLWVDITLRSVLWAESNMKKTKKKSPIQINKRGIFAGLKLRRFLKKSSKSLKKASLDAEILKPESFARLLVAFVVIFSLATPAALAFYSNSYIEQKAHEPVVEHPVNQMATAQVQVVHGQKADWEQIRLAVDSTPTKPKASPIPNNKVVIDGVKPTVEPNVWDHLCQCEAGGNWAANTGNGYYGGLQFSHSTWRSAGGVGNPANASREEQILRAEKVLQSHGWGAWPACSRKLKLR